MSKQSFEELLEFAQAHSKHPSKVVDFAVQLAHRPARGKDPTDKTILSRCSNYKKFLRENVATIPESELKNLKPSEEIIQAVIQKDDKIRMNRSNVVFNQGDVDNLLSLKDSKNIVDNIIFLMFVSGRRVGEILSKEFEVSRAKKKSQTVRFSGLSKIPEEKNQPVNVKLVSPITYDVFIPLLEKVRDTVGHMGNSIPDMTKKVNVRMKQLFKGKPNSPKSSHNLRGMYVYYLWVQSGKHQNINGFITEKLHHVSSDTSLNYSKYLFE